MRKITADAIRAFNNNQPFKRGNTEIVISEDSLGIKYTAMNLHGNTIAYKVIGDVAPGLFIQDGGWQTNTTKERLNGISGVSIYQKNYQWYLNGEAWNGKTTMI